MGQKRYTLTLRPPQLPTASPPPSLTLQPAARSAETSQNKVARSATREAS